MISDVPSIGFEAYGVTVAVSAPAGPLAERLDGVLPPRRLPCSPEAAELHFGLTESGDGASLLKQGDLFAGDLPVDTVLEVLEREVRTEIALRAPDVTFVHAGVVADGDRGLVLPGASFAGKSTLVAALVRAGATYFSDEYAVLDSEGRVHPYPRPPVIRGDGLVGRADASVLDGAVGEHAVGVAAVFVTTYRDGASWQPEPLSHGEAVLALLSNTVTAQTRPSEGLRAATRAVEGALLQHGERGDAKSTAPLMLDALRAS